MLANVTVDGDPVATIRFMGGREYDVISGPSHAIVTKEAVAAVIARGQMAEPSFAAGGPFPGAPGRLVGPQPETDIERAAIATLYVAAMMATSLDLVQSTNDIILDGGLAHNTALCATLAALRPAQPLYRNIDAAGTAKGAAALAFRELGLKHVFSLDVERVEPWDLPGLAAYYASWSANAEAGAYGSFV
jgi:sugar (pentulose or hexulose) kinase